MHRLLLFCLATAVGTGSVLAQSSDTLYIPRDMAIAYQKGTRSMNGEPGPHYWQNFGRYHIQVTALPPDRTIRGTEQITYVNNSPDVLRNLVIRIVQNIHRPGVARYGDAAPDYLSTGTIIDKFTENGQEREWMDPMGHATWQMVPLLRPLAPHDSVELTIDWHYTISLKSGREGMIDSTTYYLAYFYPRVSVYDDYNGWDRLPFTDGQEFYNDFNDYTLDVTVPRNYIVWATGTLQDADQVLQPAYAEKLRQSMTSDAVSTIAGPSDLSSHSVTADHSTNTWTWTSTHITDVTVALSDHYDWDATSVVVDPSSGRRTSVQSAYNDTAADFHHMAAFGSHAIGWFSRNWPGVPFPFPKMTVVQGYADMEYPMMVNDGTTPDLDFSRLVADHEIAHSYFPFYMGINESRYAFMDEGWATTLELLIGRTELQGDSADVFYKNFRVKRWINDPSQNEDLPIITPSNDVNGVAYGNNSYGKASLGYLAMKDMLGDELFGKCLHAYMDRWHGKHPVPWDFFFTFDDVSGMDLNWFWNSWYFSNGYIDLAIHNVARVKGGYSVTLANVGGWPAPFDLVLTYLDGSTQRLHETPAVWSQGDHRTAQVLINTKNSLRKVLVDGGIWMDANTKDNVWEQQ